MDPELHRYLDRECPLERLSEEARKEAETWEQIQAAWAPRRPKAPPDLLPAVMEAIRGRTPRRGMFRPVLGRVHFRRAGIAAAAAAGFLLGVALERTLLAPREPAPTGAEVIHVQFVLPAPGARSVAVAGDFSGWAPDLYRLQDDDGDGIWTGVFPVRPGVYRYMFVLDGDRWVEDPFASAYVDDGFGGKNAILQVAPRDGGET